MNSDQHDSTRELLIVNNTRHAKNNNDQNHDNDQRHDDKNCPVRVEVATGQAADLRFANCVGRFGPAVVQLYLAHSERADPGRSTALSESSPFVRSQTPIRHQSGQPRHRPRQLTRTPPLQPGQDKNNPDETRSNKTKSKTHTHASRSCGARREPWRARSEQLHRARHQINIGEQENP